jgi:multiple antibiotic resistance protein
MQEAANAFLLGFPALFSIVNPISGAFIFNEVAGRRTPAERAHLARLVGLYSLIVMMGALWAGSYLLAFFGISLAALRVAGGMIVALSGWQLLNAPHKRDVGAPEPVGPAPAAEDIALFPLTMPITTGPGTISVAVALGAGHPKGLAALGWFFLGASAAAVALATLIWVTYRYADRVTAWMGPRGSRTVTRLAAFLLLCIGVQILITGVQDVLGPLLGNRVAG